jgi:hypothetical protein
MHKKSYEKEFYRCNEEKKNFTKGKLDYKKSFNHGVAIMSCFKSKSTNILKN